MKAVGNHCHHLKKLNLTGCKLISDVGILELTKGCGRLEELHMPRTALFFKITDVALLTLADRAPGLTKLDISGNELITDVGMDWLSSGCHALQDLNIKDLFKVTDAGLQIQLLDQAETPLFQPGSARLTRHAELLVLLVANMGQQMPNEITISGHTDAAPYGDSQGLTNWELSLERANASRRELLRHGVKGKSIASIVGLADKVPLLIDNPTSPQNRRVSIVLLREKIEMKKKTPPKPPRVF